MSKSKQVLFLSRIALWCLALISAGLYIAAVAVDNSSTEVGRHQPARDLSFRNGPRNLRISAACLTCDVPDVLSSRPLFEHLNQISLLTKINFVVDVAIVILTSFTLVKSKDIGAADFIVSTGVFCKVYLLPYIMYSFLAGDESPVENIEYLLNNKECGTLKECLNGNVARMLFSCIVIFVIMVLAIPTFIASCFSTYIFLVHYFGQETTVVTERIDDLPSYSALFPDSNNPNCELLEAGEHKEQNC